MEANNLWKRMKLLKSLNSSFTTKRKAFFLMLLILIPLAILEIWSLNRLATYGVEISKIEIAKQALQLENQILENKISDEASLINIENKAKKLGFVKVSKIEFLKELELALNH